MSTDRQLQLTLRVIDGLPVAALSEDDRECVSQAIARGYLYREGDMLYLKILINRDKDDPFRISKQTERGCFDKMARQVAEKLAALIGKAVPAHLRGEWRMANMLVSVPFFGLDGGADRARRADAA